MNNLRNGESLFSSKKTHRQLQVANRLSEGAEARLYRRIVKAEERNRGDGEGRKLGERGEVGFCSEEFVLRQGRVVSPGSIPERV